MPLRSWAPDGGSSLPSAILAMMSCVLLALPLLGSLRSAWSAAAGASERATAAAASLKADAVLRSLAARIRPPWWTALDGSLVGPKDARLPWLDGDREGEALLSWEEGILTIREKGLSPSSIAFLEGFTLSFLPPAGPPRGLRARWRAGGRDWECRAPFGGLPLAAGGEGQ